MSENPTDAAPVTPAHLRAFILFAAAIAPVCVLAFLIASQFFVAWEGRVTGVNPLGTGEPTAYQVVIASEDHTYEVRTWPAETVAQLKVPYDPLLVPPSVVGDSFPQTTKGRFQLHFLVTDEAGANLLVPTTSPQALGVAVLLAILFLAVRNGYVSGNPIDIRPRATELPAPLPPSGQVAPALAGQKGRFQPPPPKSKGGRRQRR